jgi:hypothetical protein
MDSVIELLPRSSTSDRLEGWNLESSQRELSLIVRDSNSFLWDHLSKMILPEPVRFSLVLTLASFT